MAQSDSYVEMDVSDLKKACNRVIVLGDEVRKQKEDEYIDGLLKINRWLAKRFWWLGIKAKTKEAMIAHVLRNGLDHYGNYPSLHGCYSKEVAVTLSKMCDDSTTGTVKVSRSDYAVIFK